MSVKVVRVKRRGDPDCAHRFRTERAVLATGLHGSIKKAPTHKVRRRKCRYCGRTQIEEVRR